MVSAVAVQQVLWVVGTGCCVCKAAAVMEQDFQLGIEDAWHFVTGRCCHALLCVANSMVRSQQLQQCCPHL
jgi:hypothetical protein